jgi:hypothetical protein
VKVQLYKEEVAGRGGALRRVLLILFGMTGQVHLHKHRRSGFVNRTTTV